jgi:hypothetical protein
MHEDPNGELSPEGGIAKDLASSTRESSESELPVLSRVRELLTMNMNQSSHTADERSSDNRDEAVRRAIQNRIGGDLTMSSQILAGGESPNRAAWQVLDRRSFPLRTLMVCFTIWLIATEVLVFDQVKFDARAKLLDQAARAFRGPQVIVPSERPSNFAIGEEMQRL